MGNLAFHLYHSVDNLIYREIHFSRIYYCFMFIYISSVFLQFQGKHIRVDMASVPRKASEPGVANESEYDRTRSLFVGNVPFDVEVFSLL